MWKSRRLLARFPRGSWKEWETCFWFSTLSTAPPFPQLPGPVFCARRFSCLLRLTFCLLILLGLLYPIARNIQLDDHAVMHQSVDRGRRHHCILKDSFPFREW